MNWTEIIISVSTGAVESVANFLHESGAGGVVIEHQDNQVSTVTAYYPAGEETEAVLVSLDDFWTTLSELNIQTDAKVTTKEVAEQDWAEEWKKHYKPVEVGKVYITPSWLKHEAEPGRIVVELDPGMAFGTGSHPTTQMCIAEISACLIPGETVLDLGAGSGILSIVAAKLGAGKVEAVDNDGDAIRVASENALRNQCVIHLHHGDAFAALQRSDHGLVVANIGFNACSKLAKIFLEENKGGTLILSGFPVERLPEFEEFTRSKILRTTTKEGWSCLVLGQ